MIGMLETLQYLAAAHGGTYEETETGEVEVIENHKTAILRRQLILKIPGRIDVRRDWLCHRLHSKTRYDELCEEHRARFLMDMAGQYLVMQGEINQKIIESKRP